MSKLDKKPESEVEKDIHDLVEKLYKGTIEGIRDEIPDYPIAETPYKVDLNPKPKS